MEAAKLTDINLAELSVAAYGGGQDLLAAAPKVWNVVDLEWDRDDEQQAAYMLRSVTGQKACVVFRGTVPTRMRDWWTNLQAWKEGVGFGRVHDGAWDRATRLYERFSRHFAGIKELYLTGHSLGGQVATVAAHVYHRQPYFPVTLVTFGAPKALSFMAKMKFPEYIDVREYHHRRDPVGYIPVINYWHLNPVRFGRVGVPCHRPYHWSERYAEWVKLLSQ